jgi:short subunit dehydrogenase-like uncharacterized protein
MPDILLFGATGYTGRLTAHALADRDANFAIAGRNRAKLESLARETKDPEIRVASVGDTDSLVEALDGARVLISCVGPFSELGSTAVDAALRAGVHYLDSTGEGGFIDDLFERDADARAAGIAMVPAMGFDEVPADTAVALAAADMKDAHLVLTYAVPTTPSGGTARTVPSIMGQRAPWLEKGRVVHVGLGQRWRWAPLPPPLGPRRAISGPFAETRFAPRHLDLTDFETYMSVSTPQFAAMRLAGPAIRASLAFPPIRKAAAALGGRLDGPEGAGREKRWTILAEARDRSTWRNVIMTGKDVYGLTAETLAAGATMMAAGDFEATGVLTPVQAFGVQTLMKELEGLGVTIDVKQPS